MLRNNVNGKEGYNFPWLSLLHEVDINHMCGYRIFIALLLSMDILLFNLHFQRLLKNHISHKRFFGKSRVMTGLAGRHFASDCIRFDGPRIGWL